MNSRGRWESWIGQRGPVVPGGYPISLAAVGYLAEALQNEWLVAAARSGSVVHAPASFVTIASRMPSWRPDLVVGPASFMLALDVPIDAPAAVNVGTDQQFVEPLTVGAWLESQSRIVSITPKENRLGPGFVIVEEIVHRDQTGSTVAFTTNSMFRYTPRSDAGGRPPRQASRSRPSDLPLEARSILAPVRRDITITLLVAAAGAVRDMSRLHHDPDFAASQGHETAFVSYSFQQALLVDSIGGWYGASARIRRLQLSMKAPAFLGRTVTCSATRLDDGSDGQPLRLRMELSTEDGLCTSALAEVDLVADLTA